MTKKLVESGFNVVITYPVPASDLEYLATNLSALDTDIYVITLCPPLDVALSDRSDRELTDWEHDRIRELYDKGVHRPDFGTCIDNADQSPAETVDEI